MRDGSNDAEKGLSLTDRIRRFRRVILLAILAAAAAGPIYAVAFRPRPVVAHTVGRGEVVEEVLGTGSLESRRTIDLGFEVTGRVASLAVDQGDLVRAGQDIATIAPETFRAAVAVAGEDLKLARASLDRLVAEVARGEAVLAAADSHRKRMRDLRPQGAISQQDLDDADERATVAAADLARVRAARIEGDRRISAAEQALLLTKADLDRTVARAPFDGIVLRRVREVGQVAPAGSAVVRIAATDVIWATVWVDETFLGGLREGAPARVVLRSAPSSPIRGRVARIGREVDRETRELLVDVALDAPPGALVLGQRVDLWIEVARRPDALRIPAEAIAYVAGAPGVFLDVDGRSRYRPVTTGARGLRHFEVTDGLSGGESVIRPAEAGGAPLAEGARVRARPEAAP